MAASYVKRVCDAGAAIFGVPPEKLFLTNGWKPSEISMTEDAVAYVLWAVGMDPVTISGELRIEAPVRVVKAVRARKDNTAYDEKISRLFMIAHRGGRGA